jgi:hypothetical protein
MALNSSIGPRPARGMAPTTWSRQWSKWSWISDPLGVGDRRLDGVELLGDVEARTACRDHLDHALEVPGHALQPLHYIRVALVQVSVRQREALSPGRG